MAWPRIKNPRSSARPGTPPRDTATPAPGAEPARDSRHPGRIRYEHSGEPGTPTAPAPHDTAPYDTAPYDTAPLASAPGGQQPGGSEPADAAPPEYDETAGLVYEASQPEYPGAASGTPPETAGSGTGSESAGGGLSIFGAAAHAAGDAGRETAGDLPPPHEYPVQAQPSATEPEPAVKRVGATWNQPIASPPEAAGEDGDSKRRTFGIRIPRLAGRLAAASGGQPDGQSRVAIRDLPPDVQMRIWRLRAAIMVVVALIVLILLKSWVLALTFAILAGIIDTLYRARNAANYVNGASQLGARRRTRRQLARMRRAGYFALDARPIPNSREFIDHLVIGPTGVYAIDSEKWDSKLPIRTWNGKKLYHGPESQKPRLEHAVWEAAQASEILSGALGTEITVRPALAIYGPKIPWDIATIRNVDVFTGSALRKYLKRRGRMRGETPKLTREQVRTIYDTATRMLPDVAPASAATPVS